MPRGGKKGENWRTEKGLKRQKNVKRRDALPKAAEGKKKRGEIKSLLFCGVGNDSRKWRRERKFVMNKRKREAVFVGGCKKPKRGKKKKGKGEKTFARLGEGGEKKGEKRRKAVRSRTGAWKEGGGKKREKGRSINLQPGWGKKKHLNPLDPREEGGKEVPALKNAIRKKRKGCRCSEREEKKKKTEKKGGGKKKKMRRRQEKGGGVRGTLRQQKTKKKGGEGLKGFRWTKKKPRQTYC